MRKEQSCSSCNNPDLIHDHQDCYKSNSPVLSSFMTIRILTRVARRVPHVQKELNTLPKYLRLPPVLVCFRFLCNVLYVFVGRFVLLLLVIILSVFWSLYCLSFGHYIVCLLVIILSVFWSLYCLSFGHYIVCFLVIIL
jgi:hypothetical protein